MVLQSPGLRATGAPTASPAPTEALPRAAAGGLFGDAGGTATAAATTAAAMTATPTTAAAATTAVPPGPALACPARLAQSVPVDGRTTLRYAVVPASPPGARNGLLCGRLESDNGGGWVGLGVTRTGVMVGSEAIVGVPAAGTVLKYDMRNLTLSGLVPMADARQTLRDARVTADAATGRVTLEFAKLLTEDGEIPLREDGRNFFLHARGSAPRLGYHDNGHGSFFRDFSADVYADDDDEEEEEAAEAEADDEAEQEPAARDCDGAREFCDVALDPDYVLRYRLRVPPGSSVAGPDRCAGCAVAVELVHEGAAWVSLAVSRDGTMLGGEAVM